MLLDTKFKRIVVITCTTLIVTIALVILFSSVIAKYVTEKLGEKYTGRRVSVDWVYINLFTGHVYFSNLKIYENKSDTVFFSSEGISADFAINKLLSKTYEISSITLDKPWARAIQNNKSTFNFSDILDKFSSKGPSSSPTHFNLLNIKVNNGEFHYIEKEVGANYFIKNTYFESSGKWWNKDTLNVQFSFQSGPGTGEAHGSWTFNFATAGYRFNAIIHRLDLKTLEQYMLTMANYGKFTANMDANVNATGNFKDASDLNGNGLITINDFHISKVEGEDYASFDKMTFKIIKLNPKNHIYFFDSLIATHPYFLYERYDYLDNIERMFGENGANVATANSDQTKFNLLIALAYWAQALAKNFFSSDFKINHLAINNGSVQFNDYSPTEKFAIEANPVNIISDSIYKDRQRVHLSLKTNIKPYGTAYVYLSMNPKDYTDFDMTYSLRKLPLPLFNPYTITYSSFPFDRGTLELTGQWTVRKGEINSANHLLIIDPFTTNRLKNKGNKWLPVPLIMAIVRERGDVIDYEIPVTGNFNKPAFHLRHVIVDILGNIFIKPPTIPYAAHINEIDEEVEKSIMLPWEMQHAKLQPGGDKFLDKLTGYLKKNPGTSVTIYPFEYAAKEKEYILLYEAKKKYFLIKNNIHAASFTTDDSIKVDKMSVKDSSFTRYLNKHVATPMMFTIQEKCAHFIDSNIVIADYAGLMKERENYFINYFQKNGVESQVKIDAPQSVIPYNGFSYYQLKYNGEIPSELSTAYQEMDDINGGWFRRKYKNIRNAIKSKYEKPVSGKTNNQI